jgi:hypothetical protein
MGESAQRCPSKSHARANNKQPKQHTPINAQAAAAELVVPSKQLVTPKYCESIHQTKRRPTRTVHVSFFCVCVDNGGGFVCI